MIASKLRTLIGIALPALVLTLAQAAAAQPPAYLLDCRGGGPMSASYEPNGNGSQLRIFFSKAPRGTDYGALAPGECAWRDRPLNQGETPVLMFSSSERISRLGIAERGISVDPVTSSLTKLLYSVFAAGQFTVLIGQNVGNGLVIHQVY